MVSRPAALREVVFDLVQCDPYSAIRIYSRRKEPEIPVVIAVVRSIQVAGVVVT